MLVCAKCKREMKCELNGVRCRWNGSHIYPGDLFKCPECGTEIINTGNVNAYHNTTYTDTKYDYYMDSFYDEHVRANETLNLRRKKKHA